MKLYLWTRPAGLCAGLAGLVAVNAAAPLETPPLESSLPALAEPEANWNWHSQSTAVVQGHGHFNAPYEGDRSLRNYNEIRETISFDLTGGVRPWRGGELFADVMSWQGYGLGNAMGVEAFPNGEAFRVGNKEPNFNIVRAFLRQTIGLGGETETVADDSVNLAGKRDISRLTITAGKISAKDLFDNNTYANNPRTQFLDWSLMANNAWDYPADALGYMTGLALDLNQPRWAIRYGLFQTPQRSNGTAIDGSVLEAWSMVTEFEFRYATGDHPGAVRLLGYLNRANMGSYADALADATRPADVTLSRQYRCHFGVGLNWEQAITRDLGAFSRLGWSDGETEAWHFNDVDRTVTGGLSLRGTAWHRPTDTFGIGGGLNGISRIHQTYLAAGGLGILAGDGQLSYGWEKFFETYYDFLITQQLHASLHYQFVANPAFNSDRGPIHILGARIHWEF